MKLIVKNESGLTLLRPSKRQRKLGLDQQRALAWVEVLENGPARQNYPLEVKIAPGAHEMERIENPFVPGGESWLVLKGSRIGAAESYLQRLAAATRGTRNAIELLATPLTTVEVPPTARPAAA